jgi:hypothetical protein
MTYNFELLRELTNQFKAIPAGNVNLSVVVNPCGTQACFIGHCALMDNGCGLGWDDDEGMLTLRGQPIGWRCAAMALFGFESRALADALFSSNLSHFDMRGPWTDDKDRVIKRIEQFFADHGQQM